MQDPHEPHSEFIDRLDWQIGREVRRRNRSAQSSRLKAVIFVVGLMLLSMGIGAAATAAAYRAQTNERRELLIYSYTVRADLARQRAASARAQLQATERFVSLGTASREAVLEDRVKVAEAETQLKSIELELAEIRITGLEPMNEVSSPLVSGRDFVSERLRVGMSVPETALELERSRLRETEKGLTLGVADVLDVDGTRARTIEVEAALNAFQRKIELRQQFLSRKINAREAELRVLEVEALQRRKTLSPKDELAGKLLERARRSVQLGTGQRTEAAEAALRSQEVHTERVRAEYDLAVIQGQLEAAKGIAPDPAVRPSPLFVAPASVAIQPPSGSGMLSVSQSGNGLGPGAREGALFFFRIERSGILLEEKRLETKPLAFTLSPGGYELLGYSRACDGNCNRLGPPAVECTVPFTLAAGQVLYAERVLQNGTCTIRFNSPPSR